MTDRIAEMAPRTTIRTAGRRLAWVTMVATALVASAANAAGYRAPRTSFGQPDLHGVWTNSSLTMLQRPPIFKSLVATDAEAAVMDAYFRKMLGDIVSSAPIDPNAPAPPVVKEAPQTDFLEMDLHLARIGGQMRSSWIVDPPDGRLPFTDAGRKATREAEKETFDGPEGRPLSERCLTAVGSPEGPPMMNTGFNANYQIVQTKDYVAIEVEMDHDVRIIRLGDRTHIPDSVRPWMGDSVGWWEGDTLVVETTNLNPAGAFITSLGGDFAYSPRTKIVERFTRTAKDQMLYEFSVDDPVNFTKVWRAQMPWRAAKGPIYEYACHEGNYSLPNALSGAREEERAATLAAGGDGHR
ncbi:MAG: hypothetical protein ACHP7N_04465 [Caulobacterales bacterium]